MKKNKMNKLIDLICKYREIIMYVIIGGMTTAVYFVVYAIFKYMGVHYEINTCISWFAAVMFAFVTNKYLVFRSMKREKAVGEFFKFVGARLTTLGIDLLFTFLLIQVFTLNEWVAKIAVQFIVLILNYVLSKLFVFSNTKQY